LFYFDLQTPDISGVYKLYNKVYRVLKNAFIKDKENKDFIIFKSSKIVDSSSKNLNIASTEFLA
jgi:hypothetical protein